LKSLDKSCAVADASRREGGRHMTPEHAAVAARVLAGALRWFILRRHW
jgi:hypothetical protein